MTTNPPLSILQGEDPSAEAEPPVPAPSARATVAASPTLAVVGGQPGPARPVPAPVGGESAARDADAGAAETPAATAPAPAREVAQQGAQVAQAPPKFKLPPVDEMVADYQRWSMMASDPEVAKEVAPRMAAWKNLTLRQHAQAFPGDPMASPDQAAAYARHMGQISGRLGAPMSWEEAGRIAEYTEGRKAKLPTQFMEGMNRYDQALVQPLVDDVFGDGWEMVSLAPGKTTVGGTEMEVPTLTVRDKASGATKAYTPIDVSAVFGNMEGKLRYAKENREQTLRGLQADLEQAKARQDPEAAYQAWEKMQELQGGTGGFGGGQPARAKVLGYMPTVQAILQDTQSPLDPLFVMSIMNHESKGDPKATSPKNAQGLMQLIPATAKRFGVKNAYDPVENITGSIKYLNWLHDRYDGDLTKVAAAYNAGEGNVDKYGGVPPFKETKGYVKDVLGTYRTHKATPGDDPKSIGQRLIGAPVAATGGAGGAAAGTAATGTAPPAQAAALAKHEAMVNKMYEKAAGDPVKMDTIDAFDRRKRAEMQGGGGNATLASLMNEGVAPAASTAPGAAVPGAAKPPAVTGEAVLAEEAGLIDQAKATTERAATSQRTWDTVRAAGDPYLTYDATTGPPPITAARRDLTTILKEFAALDPGHQAQARKYLRQMITLYPELAKAPPT